MTLDEINHQMVVYKSTGKGNLSPVLEDSEVLRSSKIGLYH